MAAATPSCVCPGCDADAIRRIAIRAQWRSSEKLGGQWPDREVAVTMNRMRCKPSDGKAWTTIRVRELRERLGIAPFDPEFESEAVKTGARDARPENI
jgi:hypothetical protein